MGRCESGHYLTGEPQRIVQAQVVARLQGNAPPDAAPLAREPENEMRYKPTATDAEILRDIRRVMAKWTDVGFRADGGYLAEIYHILKSGPADLWHDGVPVWADPEPETGATLGRISFDEKGRASFTPEKSLSGSELEAWMNMPASQRETL